MGRFSDLADRAAIEAESAWADRDMPETFYQFLSRARDQYGANKAMTYQLTSGPTDPAETWLRVSRRCLRLICYAILLA